jgi:hypothetical protein
VSGGLILLVLACWSPTECMAVRTPVETVAECRIVYQRLRASQPEWRWGYPECMREGKPAAKAAGATR